jgi:hypothetical protein
VIVAAAIAAARLGGAVPRRRAAQTIAAFVLRAHRIATVPLVITSSRSG